MNDCAVIARVILLGNGEVHILLSNLQTVYCTAEALFALLSFPYDFCLNGYKVYDSSTRYVNEKRCAFEDVQGLTLVEIYKDTSSKILFPALIQRAAEKLSDKSAEKLNFINYIYKNTFTDQKDFYIQTYLQFFQVLKSDIVLDRKIPLTNAWQNQAVQELINSSFCVLSNLNSKTESSEIFPAKMEYSGELPVGTLLYSINEPNMVPLSVYADKLGVAKSTVIAWCKKNKLHSAKQDSTGKWFVDINEERPKDRRAGRKCIEKEGVRKNIRLKGTSYEDVQKYIEERKLVTNKIRHFVRSYEEIKYYENHNYHEVEWNGCSALIIDINLYYRCERLGKTNKELILAGESPVVPENDEYHYDIHHIGQRKDSPFAIIPSMVHNSKEYFSVFHSGSSSEELHTKEFEIEKQIFWRNYLNAYEKANGVYSHIPFLNSKHKKDKR